METKSKKFLGSKLGIVPATGYTVRNNYSHQSILWLEWLQKPGLQIQHALNGGEFKIPRTNYRVDGYCHETKTVYEFLGCLWHGCRTCYPQRNMALPKTNETAEVLWYHTQERLQHIRHLGYNVVTIWEHEFHHLQKEDQSLEEFAKTCDVQPRLNIRDAFFGGRTNATRLHYKITEGETIRYVDFTSLYPWTNNYQRYPVGHPEIITREFQNINSYFGLAKVKILPPRGLYHPVLPCRIGGKLMFLLCHKCAFGESTVPCTCTAEQRCLVGTWCIPEITKAMECGYELINIYEIYHWKETACYDPTTRTGGLFSEFVDTFLKLKQESSGWPAWCDTEDKKQKYILDYYENEGVRLDYDAVVKNPGKRMLAKLMLNR